MLKLFPATRFSYANLIVQRCINNKSKLEKMIENSTWSSIKHKINEEAVSTFELNFGALSIRKMNCLHEFLCGVTKATHYIESVLARSSWVYVLICTIL